MKKWPVVVVAVSALALVAAGCGGDNKGGGGSAATTTQPAQAGGAQTGTQAAPAGAPEKLALAADPSGQLAFDKKTLTAKSGQVEIDLSNPSDLPHNVTIEGNGIDKGGQTVGKGQTSTVTADLKPGQYTFYCSVPGHRQGGMEGTLTVK